MNKKYFIIVGAIIGVLLIISFINHRRVQNQDGNYTKETYEDAPRVNNTSDLTKLSNSIIYFQNSENYLLQIAVVLASSIDRSKSKIDFQTLPSDEIFKYTNYLLSDGEKVCYSRKFLLEEANNLFHRRISTIPTNDEIYQIYDTSTVCFGSTFLNDIPLQNQQINTLPNSDIEIILSEEQTSLKVLFSQNYGNYYIKEVTIY